MGRLAAKRSGRRLEGCAGGQNVGGRGKSGWRPGRVPDLAVRIVHNYCPSGSSTTNEQTDARPGNPMVPALCRATTGRSEQMSHRTTRIGPAHKIRFSRLLVSGTGAAAIVFSALLAAPQVAGASTPTTASSTPFLDTLHQVINVAATVPKNGDVNPYGIVNVPESVGRLVKGETLISNFNASS